MDKNIFTHFFLQLNRLLGSPLMICLLLLTACLNTILRIDPSNPLTAYRLFAPLLVLTFAVFRSSNLNCFYYFLLFYIYNFIISLVSPFSSGDTYLYTINYLYLFMLYFFLRELYFQSTQLFFIYIVNFIKLFLILIYTLYFTKYFFGINLIANFDRSFYINTLYTTPNDLALALGSAFIIIIFNKNTHFVEKIIHTLVLFFINFQNDAKTILISQLLILLLVLFVTIKKQFRKFTKPLMISMLVISFSLFFVLRNTKIDLKDGPFSISSFLTAPLVKIINLEPYYLKGSIYDRTDAAIHLIKSYLKTGGLGLGAGSSMATLVQPETMTLSARSAHNFILEWLVEFGWLTVFLLIVFYQKVWQALRKIDSNSNPEVISLGLCFPFFAVSQSSGYISNYLFWISLFFIYIKYQHSRKLDPNGL